MERKEQLAYRWVALILRAGSFLSAGVLLAGVLWALAQPDVPMQVGPPLPLDLFWDQLWVLNPYAIMQAGVLLLLLTPLLRLVVAAVSFFLEREPRYALASLVVLLIIVGSLLLTRSTG